MQKFTAALLSLLALTLTGCQGAAEAPLQETTSEASFETSSETSSGTEDSGFQTEDASDAALKTQTDHAAATDISQAGPYGTISVSLPDGWSYESCPIDSDNLMYGQYGIHFYPSEASDGYIELVYTDSFGVCGTGLSEEDVIIAGNPAWIGTYDNHEYWDFISFAEDLDNIVALTYSVDSWWSAYGDQVLDILDTVSFDRNAKEGGAYVYSAEAEAAEIRLWFSLKQITPTGATLVFLQYDAQAPDGELSYGDDFTIQQNNNGKWEDVPIIMEDVYSFDAIAHIIPVDDSSECVLDWEWLYGSLAPGEYRIRKEVLDSRGPGDNTSYILYANFILN